MSEALLGHLLAVASLLFFTAAIMFTKVASSRIHIGVGFFLATVANIVVSATAFALQLAWRDEALTWNINALLLFAAAGAFATYLGRWFFFESVVRFGPAKASLFQVSSPIFTALMAWMLLGEGLSWWAVLAIFMTVGGLMLVSYKPGSLAKGPSSDGALADQTAAQPDVLPHGFLTIRERVLRSALLLGLGSSLAYAVGNVLRGAAVRSWNEPVLGALVGALCGLALHLVFTSDNSGLVARLRSSDRSGCYLFALVGLCNISGQICVIGSMRYIPLTVATLMTLCTPILVFPLSYLFLKKQDDMTLTTVLGGVLTLLGIFIIVMR